MNEIEGKVMRFVSVVFYAVLLLILKRKHKQFVLRNKQANERTFMTAKKNA